MAKVLVVEDNIDAQNLLARALQSNYEFKMVSSIAEAWSSIEQTDWDVILLDRTLPDGDGIELCVKLKKMNLESKFPVLMLTAHGELDEKIEGLTAGADDYVVKPFEPRELVARIETILRRRTDMNSNSINTLHLANLVINIETRMVNVLSEKGEPTAVDLTPCPAFLLIGLLTRAFKG